MNIQPEWVMDENKIIFFTRFVVNWKAIPMRIDNSGIRIIRKVIVLRNIIIGISFCHVNRNNKANQFNIFLIFRIHEWNGNIPIFIKIDVIIKRFSFVRLRFKMLILFK
jgi:hypothetical protein